MPRYQTSIDEVMERRYKFLPGDMVEADLGYLGKMLAFIIGARYIEVKTSSGARTYQIGPYYDLMMYESYDDYVRMRDPQQRPRTGSWSFWTSEIPVKRNTKRKVYEDRLKMVLRP